jgi:hypothetical protein
MSIHIVRFSSSTSLEYYIHTLCKTNIWPSYFTDILQNLITFLFKYKMLLRLKLSFKYVSTEKQNKKGFNAENFSLKRTSVDNSAESF